MQIARIVPKVRTSDEGVFDYAIPPNLLPQIRIGILVEVPFRNRKIEGIVLDLRKRSKILRLKPILKIIDSDPVVDEAHIKLAKWMSDYYLVSLGQTLFENIVPPAIRTIKKSGDNTPKSVSIDLANHINNDNFLIIADFSARIQFYLKEIKKTLAKKKSVIILVPDLSMIKFFAHQREDFKKDDFSILHAGLSKTQRWLAWNKIRQKPSSIVIGSQSALFAPINNLGLIIIDQEENETYKSDRSPRFHAFDVALQLAKLTRSHLISGSVVPRVETYWSAKSAKFKIMRQETPEKKCTVVDMTAEKSIISATLEQKINENLAHHSKIILVLNHKGEGSKYSCADCGWIQTCQNCGLPLVPTENANACFRCEKTFPKTNTCSKCQGLNLKPMGLGTQKLKKILQKIYPHTKIITIEKDANLDEKNHHWEIATVTSYALKAQLPPIGLVAIVDADQNLNLPDFSSIQKSFEVFYKFLRLAPDKIIQTHHADHYMIKNLASLDSKNFLKEELVTRKNELFPPFYQLIRLEYRNQDISTAKNESQRVFSALSKINDPSVSISSPFQPYIQKRRDKFRFQIIVRHKGSALSDITENIIKSLPKGWIVDVDPFSLL